MLLRVVLHHHEHVRNGALYAGVLKWDEVGDQEDDRDQQQLSFVRHSNHCPVAGRTEGSVTNKQPQIRVVGLGRTGAKGVFIPGSLRLPERLGHSLGLADEHGVDARKQLQHARHQ